MVMPMLFMPGSVSFLTASTELSSTLPNSE